MQSHGMLRIAAGLAIGMVAASWVAFDRLGDSAYPAADADEPVRSAIRNTGAAVGAGFLMDFTRGHDPAVQYLSEYEMNEDWIKVAFRERNIRFSKEGMTLELAKSLPGEKLPFSASEFQRKGNYGYGRYEVVLKSADASGAVASFFTYTGPSFGDPHDEIDFEFVGANPRSVHVNYFHRGGNNPADIPLWFDTAQAEHIYAFEWLPDSIRWYADGVKIHDVQGETAAVKIPTTSGRVMANLWAASGEAVGWTGEPRFARTRAAYRCMSHVPIGKTGPQCSDSFKPPPRP